MYIRLAPRKRACYVCIRAYFETRKRKLESVRKAQRALNARLVRDLIFTAGHLLEVTRLCMCIRAGITVQSVSIRITTSDSPASGNFTRWGWGDTFFLCSQSWISLESRNQLKRMSIFGSLEGRCLLRLYLLYGDSRAVFAFFVIECVNYLTCREVSRGHSRIRLRICETATKKKLRIKKFTVTRLASLCRTLLTTKCRCIID